MIRPIARFSAGFEPELASLLSGDELIPYASQAGDTAEATSAMELAPPTPSRALLVLHRRPVRPARAKPVESQFGVIRPSRGSPRSLRALWSTQRQAAPPLHPALQTFPRALECP